MFVLFALLLSTKRVGVGAFQPTELTMSATKAPCRAHAPRKTGSFLTALASQMDDEGGVDEYRNTATSFLSNFMKKSDGPDPFQGIDFDMPKQPTRNLEILATTLDAELCDREWFVTGNVNPSYFANEFKFQDPDVKVSGIEEYARGVYKLFDQQTSRAEIISTVVNSTVPNTITITWRLSGKVNIGPGLTIKPYICYTDFTVRDGLIVFQEDRFDIPGWDILLSALFPFLIGRVTSPPAPPVPPREFKPVSESKETTSPLDRFMRLFQ